jgi:hypothetical protein
MDKNTSRRNFVAGLATTAIVTPVAAFTMSKEETSSESMESVIFGMIAGYVKNWVHRDDITYADAYEVWSTIDRMLYGLQPKMIYEHKVYSKENNGRLKLKIALKMKPNSEFKVWNLHRGEDEAWVNHTQR